MTMKKWLLAFCLIPGLLAWPQEQVPNQGNAGSSGSNSSSSGNPQENPVSTSDQTGMSATTDGSASESGVSMSNPMPVNSGGSSLAFASELSRTNYLNGGFSFGSTFDDNALNAPDKTTSNLAYTFQPYIALRQTRPRLDWIVNYGGGFTINRPLNAWNQGYQDFGTDMRYRLSPHVTLRLRDGFTITNNFLSGLTNNSTNTGASILQSPNESGITPPAKNTRNAGTGEVDYQVSRSGMIGFSGTSYQSRYDNVQAGSSLLSTDSEGATGFYNQRISLRHGVGLTYAFQRWTFSPGGGTAVAHSFLYVHTVYLKRTMTLSLFVGPQYSDVENNYVSRFVAIGSASSLKSGQRQWTVSGGSSYAWNGKHTSLVAEFSRRENDGGGLIGAVILNNADATVRRQLSRTMDIEVGGSYANSHALNAFPASAFRTFSNGCTLRVQALKTGPGQFDGTVYDCLNIASGRIAVGRRIAPNLWIKLGYAREYQQQYSPTPDAIVTNHNRAWFSISYSFTRPLGK